MDKRPLLHFSATCDIRSYSCVARSHSHGEPEAKVEAGETQAQAAPPAEARSEARSEAVKADPVSESSTSAEQTLPPGSRKVSHDASDRLRKVRVPEKDWLHHCSQQNKNNKPLNASPSPPFLSAN